MKKFRIMVAFMAILATLVFGMITSLCSASGGFVVGGGNLANGDSFGGNVMGMKDGRVRGQWQHYYNDGASRFHGYAEFLYCWNDGGPGSWPPEAYPNRAIFGGMGTWQGQPGYLWIVAVADYGEGKAGTDATFSDAYAITIYREIDGDGIATAADEVVYEFSGCISSGNIQVIPPTNGHPYIPIALTAEMNRVSTSLPVCTGS